MEEWNSPHYERCSPPPNTNLDGVREYFPIMTSGKSDDDDGGLGLKTLRPLRYRRIYPSIPTTWQRGWAMHRANSDPDTPLTAGLPKAGPRWKIHPKLLIIKVSLSQITSCPKKGREIAGYCDGRWGGMAYESEGTQI